MHDDDLTPAPHRAGFLRRLWQAVRISDAECQAVVFTQLERAIGLASASEISAESIARIQTIHTKAMNRLERRGVKPDEFPIMRHILPSEVHSHRRCAPVRQHSVTRDRSSRRAAPGRRRGSRRVTTSSSCSSGGDPPGGSDGPPRLRLWRHEHHGLVSPALLRVLVREGGRR